MADLGGRRGGFLILNDSAVFRTLQVGTEERDMFEVLGGLKEGEEVITTGARALRDGDRVVLAGGQRGGGQGRRGGRQGAGDGASEGGAAAIKPAADAVQGTAPRQYGAREGGRRGTGTCFTPGGG